MMALKHSSLSFLTVLIIFLLSLAFVQQFVNCKTTASKLPVKLAQQVKLGKTITFAKAEKKENVLSLKVKADTCSLQYVSVGLPTTGNFDHSPEDDGTFESNIHFGEAGGDAEDENSSPATVSSSSFFISSHSKKQQQSNSLELFSESNPNSFLVYPTSVRVPLCTGACGRTGLEARLHICQPTGSIVREVLQVAQIISVVSTTGNSSSSSDTNPTFHSSSVRMGSRQVKVALHTGCRCACRANPEGHCPPGKWFNRERCRCECNQQQLSTSVDPLSCARRHVSEGAMFWDETTCQCRCPQLFSSYVRLMPPSKLICPFLSTLDPLTCQCVGKNAKNN